MMMMSSSKYSTAAAILAICLSAKKCLEVDSFSTSLKSLITSRSSPEKPFFPKGSTAVERSNTNNHRLSRLTFKSSALAASTEADDDTSTMIDFSKNGDFDLTTALFCGGLAFDAYAEPPKNSSRWERGSSGLNVAFQSNAFTRSLYKGVLQVQPIRCTDLPDEDDTAEGLLTGSGVDAYLLVSIVEGKWTEDVKRIEQQYNDGVFELQGCAHVGRSSTAWSNVNEKQAKVNKMKKDKEGNIIGSGAYHIKSSWGKGGQAVWKEDPPFYLYVQEPTDARLVCTIMDDDVVGSGSSIGSGRKKLTDLFTKTTLEDPIGAMKNNVLARIKKGEDVDMNSPDLVKENAPEWDGSFKMASKPKKKDKNGQIAAGAAAGAMVAGPLGAAVGGAMASFYEGEVRGRVEMKINYLPIPQETGKREKYKVKGGMPGVNWGELYERQIDKVKATLPDDAPDPHLGGSDLEFCSFVTHDKTGCSCAIYRSLEKKRIAISFRGTCELVDLVTDASIIQDAWIEGENMDDESIAKVHIGFRNSLQSISRRLKELVLAAVPPGEGESISDYDLIVTGHSLGGALSTLFTADVGEFGIDAGRGLPQLEPSEPWWNSLASNFMGNKNMSKEDALPPRPKSLKMYNYGSPRVGNEEFVSKFQSLIGNGINEAYRIVNGQDVVARLPRTVNALGIVSVGYDHCGPTVLISIPEEEGEGEGAESNKSQDPMIWIEGINEGDCLVRDGNALKNPLSKGTLIGDIVSAVQGDDEDTAKDKDSNSGAFSKLTTAMKGRFDTFSMSDIPGIVGIDKDFVDREAKIIQSLVSGDALSNHMEDQYYLAMGRACGYSAIVGEEIKSLE